MENRPKKKVSNIMLAIIITLVVLYTAGAFALEIYCCREISPTLTGAFFSFFSFELSSISAIKNTKVRNNRDDDDNDNNYKE